MRFIKICDPSKVRNDCQLRTTKGIMTGLPKETYILSTDLGFGARATGLMAAVASPQRKNWTNLPKPFVVFGRVRDNLCDIATTD